MKNVRIFQHATNTMHYMRRPHIPLFQRAQQKKRGLVFQLPVIAFVDLDWLYVEPETPELHDGGSGWLGEATEQPQGTRFRWMRRQWHSACL